MSERLKELRARRAETIQALQAITNTAQAEKRDLSAEELAKHSEIFDKADNLRKQIEAEERTLEAARQTAANDAPQDKREEVKDGDRGVAATATPEYRTAFRKFLAFGRSELTGDEIRALSAGVASQGGFTVVPEQFANDLIKFVDDMVHIRTLATTMKVPNAASLGVPTLEADPSDADWTSELATGGEDSAMAFGKRKMTPYPLAKRIKVSNDLLRIGSNAAGPLNIETLVRSRLGYKFGITQEKAYLLGHGANQPLGLFTASADGVPTSRDVSAGNTSTSIGMDGLIAAKYSLKDQYRDRARWLLHRDAVKQISQLKDTTNQYLWQPSVQAGQPDRLLNLPVLSSEYVPNTFTTGKYVGMLADFSFYWIVDAMDLAIQRLVELYAEANQTGFIARLFTDGQPVLPEAFARVKLA